MPLQDEERLFIEAIRDLNYQASKLQAEENQVMRGEFTEEIDQMPRGRSMSNLDPKEFSNGSRSRPISPLSRLAALAAVSEADECASKTLDLAATAVMHAAQKANHNTASYNLEGAMSWIQAHRVDLPPTSSASPSTNSTTDGAQESRDRVGDTSGGSNTTDEEDDGTLIAGSKRKNKKITLSKRSFSSFSNPNDA